MVAQVTMLLAQILVALVGLVAVVVVVGQKQVAQEIKVVIRQQKVAQVVVQLLAMNLVKVQVVAVVVQLEQELAEQAQELVALAVAEQPI